MSKIIKIEKFVVMSAAKETFGGDFEKRIKKKGMRLTMSKKVGEKILKNLQLEHPTYDFDGMKLSQTICNLGRAVMSVIKGKNPDF